MRILEIIINNSSYQLAVNEHDTLARVLREKANLTGTKIGCEQGSCGACTVLLDGQPVQSCMTPALRCEGSEITTIEGIAKHGVLHPLQEKFVQKGAIQCGYCTPGMVMTSLSFAREHPGASKTEIREALSGNLCRCTGYKKIIEAVAEYAMELSGNNGTSAEEIKKFVKVGDSRPYLDAEKKVTGTADYADDFMIKRALHCKFLRSPYPHAFIEDIDCETAQKLEGVHAVITGAELPVTFGVLPISEDETAMAVEKTRYVGEIIAAVAAENEEIAKAACKLIRVKYKPLKAFLEMESSLEEILPEEKIHEHCKFPNNIHKKAELRFGDQSKGLQESDYSCKMDFSFQGLNHAFTEPHAATAYWDENGLTIITATQVPHYLQLALSKVLSVPANRIRVIKPQVGGGFGGKSDPFGHEIIVAHLARKLGRPVKVRLTREEVFLTNHGRHPTKMTMEMGMSRGGEIKVLDADILIDGGAYGSFGVVTTYYNGVLLQGPYKIDNLGFTTRRVYTNKPQCGAMRGHGAVNSRYAVETLIDELAHQSGIDPCELRMKNFLASNTTTIGQYRITSNGVRECLSSVMRQSGWEKHYGKLPFGHGYGVACGFFISGSALPIHWNEYPQSVVHLKADLDGRVVISSGSSDIGQGSDTMLAIIVADVLGLSMNNVAVVGADTFLTPIDLGSYSSRVTFMAGNAAKMAADNLKEKITSAIAELHKVPAADLRIAEERIFTDNGSVDLSWIEAIEIATRKVGALQSSGFYNSPKLGGDFKGAGAGLSPSYSFGAVVAEVKVDPGTGLVDVINIFGAHDAGKAINPVAVEGQLEGSWHMGIGQALGEQMKYYNGLLLNANLLDYKIPTSLDTPEMTTTIIESQDPEGPFGAKECGEGALHPVIPAIGNAIYDAVGIRVKSLPIDPELILKELSDKEIRETEPVN